VALAARPWGFRLEDIRVPVRLWHGELDVSAPSAMGRYLAGAIPRCRALFVEGAGHFLVYDIWPEVLGALAPS
jgi:pimeloyl-ACP methyl ester carboxylesterase